MIHKDFQTLVARRLDDMATQCEVLLKQGNVLEAMLIREEGLALATAYDEEQDFLFLGDFTTI